MATTVQTLGMYYFDSLQKRWNKLIEDNMEYVVYYLVATSFFSFAATHYLLRNEDGVKVSAGLKDVVSLCIRVIGLIFLYNSTCTVSRSVLIVSSSIVCQIIVSLTTSSGKDVGKIIRSLLQKLGLIGEDVRRLSRSQLYRDRFLTEEEYRLQGQIATDSALEQLFRSESFKEWAMSHKDRIRVDPLSLRSQE